MKTYLLLGAACACLAIAPALAQTDVSSSTTVNADGSSTITARTVRKDGGGAAPGAVGGALAGAVVAGPIGAVVDDYHDVAAIYAN